jgi:uncharacterized repeat protein (TIGR02543 family)
MNIHSPITIVFSKNRIKYIQGLIALIFMLSLLGVQPIQQFQAATIQATAITFSGTELLGRPTDNSITINIIPDTTIEYHYQYGISPGVYPTQTPNQTAIGGQPHEIVISGLTANTKYYYRMRYHLSGETDWIERDEHSFWTQRAPGSTFTFTITSDSHVNIMLGNPTTWTQTLDNVDADHPDFNLDLGDTFAMDNVTNVSGAENAYLYQRQFFDIISHSASIFLAAGNHEQEEGWHLDDTGNVVTSQPVMGVNAKKKYYLNPVPDSFYTGNIDTLSALDGDHLREDYYAWTWGDVLFVVIDPYWYTTTKPFIGNTGGGESSDTGSGDRWDWTLGFQQYTWLKQTLENSNAKYKFVFAHHMLGGSDDYVRGGAVPAHLVEWGGYDENGTTWGFDSRRAGWENPIRQVLIDNNVSAFFHGHDHQYAYEIRDEIVYQSLPAAGFSGNGFGIYHESDPYTEKVLPSPGHLRVTVSPSQTTVDYVQTTGGGVAYSYTILPAVTPVEYNLTIAVNPTGGGTTNPAVGVHKYTENTDVGVTATPNPGYVFANWSGACTGTGTCHVIMNGDKTVTANFTAIEYTLSITSPHGTVAKDPDKATYHYGDVVQLTATPASGWTFVNWSGDASSAANPVLVTMNGNKVITANYIAIEYTLSVTSAHGTVAKDPNKATYHYGDVVQLTATPAAGWTFANWSGDVSSAANPVSVTMNGNKSVTANYIAIEYTLSVTSAHGTVAKDPDKATYHYGEVVQLTATPATGWIFANWSGDASGTANPVSLTMNGNKTVTAHYTSNLWMLYLPLVIGP